MMMMMMRGRAVKPARYDVGGRRGFLRRGDCTGEIQTGRIMQSQENTPYNTNSFVQNTSFL